MRHKRKRGQDGSTGGRRRVLVCASVASMIDQFNMPNIRLLQEMGYEVHVLCNFLEGNTCSRKRLAEFQRQLRDMGAVRHQWDCPRGIFPVKKCRTACRQVLRLLEEWDFAWMHCHSPVGGALARAAARRAGVPAVYTAHGFHFYKGAPLKNWLLYYPAERLLARWTDVLITVNREDCRLARRRMRAGKVCYTPGIGIDADSGAGCMGTDENARRTFCRKYRIPETAYILLSVGELSRRKNHCAVLRALAALHREDVYYVICGQGSLKNALIQDARRLGVLEFVRMPGFVEDVRTMYRNTDLFVFPSLQEGMPAALLEAMAAGLACVVSDIRGNRELIGEGLEASAGKRRRRERVPAERMSREMIERAGGLRFSLKEPQQLLDALEILLEDVQLREKCGLRNQKFSRRFCTAAVQPAMRRIYKQMAGQRRRIGEKPEEKTKTGRLLCEKQKGCIRNAVNIRIDGNL